MSKEIKGPRMFHVTEIRSTYNHVPSGYSENDSKQRLESFQDVAQDTVGHARRVSNLTGLLKTLLKSGRGRIDPEQADELLNVTQMYLDEIIEGMDFLNDALQNVKVFQAPIAIPEPADKRTPMTLVPSA